MSKLMKCPSCNNEIAGWAKNCPNCGVKIKKPFYKRGWFIAIAIFVAIGVIVGVGNDENTIATDNVTIGTEQEVSENQSTEAVTEETKEEQINEKVEEDVPTEFKSALKQAETYSNMMNMSKAGVYDQLTSEYGGQFTEEAAQYAIDNVQADWKKNALKSAETYQETMSMSPNAIYDQLISAYGGQFTEEEAQYAIDNLK